MAVNLGEEIEKIRNVGDLIRVLGLLESEGLTEDDYPLLQLILRSLERQGIELLEANRSVEIDISKFEAEATRKLDEGVIPVKELERLLEDYEEHLKSRNDEVETLKEIIEKYNGRISEKQVERLVARRMEIYQNAKTVLEERMAVEKLGDKGVEVAAEELAKRVVLMEEKTSGLLPPEVEKELIEAVNTEVISESVEALMERRQPDGALEKKIETVMKQIDPKSARVVLREAKKIPDLSVASLKMERAVEEITEKVMKGLEDSDALGQEIVAERKEELKLLIKGRIVKAVKNNEVRPDLVREKIEGVETEKAGVVFREAEKAVEDLKADPEIKTLGATEWEERVETEMAADRPTKTEWARRVMVIKQYEEIVEELFSMRAVGEMVGEEEWSEANMWWRVMNSNPEGFNQNVKNYWSIREQINIPDDPRAAAVDKIMQLGKDEEARSFINAAQRMTGVRRWLNGIGIKVGLGEEKFFGGLKEFGTSDGGLAAIKSFVGGGPSGKLLQFFGGMRGPIGWMGTGATMGGRTILGGIGGWGGKVFGSIGKGIGGKLAGLGGKLGTFLKGALPKLASKLGALAIPGIGWILAIPSLIDMKKMGKLIAVVVVGVILLPVVMVLFFSWSVSGTVPAMLRGGNEGSEYTPDALGLKPEKIDGECSLANHVTRIKQNESVWANKELPKGCTFTQSGCGPTSVAKILTRINGSLTPDRLVHEAGSAYASMGCEGSSMTQALLTLEKYLGAEKVTYDAVTRSCDKRDIGEWIKEGKIVMVLADFYSNAEATKVSGHYTLAVTISDGEIVTSDPYYDNGSVFDGKKAYGHVYKIRDCLLVDTGEKCQ